MEANTELVNGHLSNHNTELNTSAVNFEDSHHPKKHHKEKKHKKHKEHKEKKHKKSSHEDKEHKRHKSSHSDDEFHSKKLKEEPNTDRYYGVSQRASAVKAESKMSSSANEIEDGNDDDFEDDYVSSDDGKKKAKKRKHSQIRKADAGNKKVKAEPKIKSEHKIKSEPKVKSEPKIKTEPKIKQEPKSTASPKKRKDVVPQDVWKWWEEERLPDGIKWRQLEHKGPVFAPPYVPLPVNVKFYYDGNIMDLSQPAEEVATFYAKMLTHDYTQKEIFNRNFFKDWRGEMTKAEKEVIRDLSKCDFREIHAYFEKRSEERKNRSKEEKKEEKLANEKIIEEYGFANFDGHKQKIGNFRIEPPGLFRGRGDHPKMGMLKRRVLPEDIIINCSKGYKLPAPEGHKWKEVRHDNTVSWLCSWTENIQGGVKYIMLNATSRLKGEKDWMKYEKARQLHPLVNQIRETYMQEWRDKEMKVRQRGVALYFIDKLALRAGNEKESEETADTVGCCSLRVEHIKLHDKVEENEFVVEFDFLGKDSIRYHNFVPVEKKVYKNLQLFMENKNGDDDLFDRINTTVLNKHLNEIMEGLTAKVFRTYNASKTLEEQLEIMTQDEDGIPQKVLSYNRANRAVAILCNHQRSVPKSFDKAMENLQQKINEKRTAYSAAKQEYKSLKAEYKSNPGSKANKDLLEKKKRVAERLNEQLNKLNVQATDKDENKTIALGTSKLNYLDPRITVAWCKRFEVPIEKCFTKTHREKFAWALDMADDTFQFRDLSTTSTHKVPTHCSEDADVDQPSDEDMEE